MLPRPPLLSPLPAHPVIAAPLGAPTFKQGTPSTGSEVSKCQIELTAKNTPIIQIRQSEAKMEGTDSLHSGLIVRMSCHIIIVICHIYYISMAELHDMCFCLHTINMGILINGLAKLLFKISHLHVRVRSSHLLPPPPPPSP